MNCRDKGKRGEREFAALLRENGFDARRGQQFSGSPDSPDVVSDALAWLHVEVKRVQNLNLTDACAQAERDQTGSGLNAADAAKPKKLAWIVAHRRNRSPWLITMRAETFFRLLRGELSPGASRTGYEGTKGTNGTDATPHPGPLPVRGGEGGKIWDAQQHVPTTENKNQKQKEQST
ncbi:MAG TPA: hypothetical protein PKO21_04820 [Verrucomicrobiota bacterium]|nr:hypothetical protein [Verrucomicrobiota bacterium]